jgi:general secretion pathway protein C
MSGISLQPNDLVRMLQGRNARLGTTLLNLLLVIWIAAQLAALTWAMLPQPHPQEPLSVMPSGTAGPDNPYIALIEKLPGLHLMGVPSAATPAVATTAPVDAPDTQLRLTLRGALASDDRAGARAIIADSTGKEEQYAIGDTVPGNAELSEVYPDRVILKRSGRYETLRLPNDDSGPGGVRGSAFRAAVPGGLPLARNTPMTPVERLRQIREQIRSSPRSLYSMIRAAPKLDANGNTMGYVVSPGNDPRLFSQIGLQSGDVVLEVNNMSLADPANGARALKSLRDGEQVTVKLLRHGVEQTVSIAAQ